MRPPKRQKKNVETPLSTPGDVLWTLQELKALLGALKSCPVNDYAAINKYLPERSLNEVKVAIERLRGQNPGRVVGTHEAAPIEKWRQKSEQLQKYDVDHSCVLSQVMSTVATLEPQTRKRGSCDPNYHAVYRYLAALMNKESLLGLAKMDAVVLLDILDGLADHLTSLDTSDQQAMMRQKYTLVRDRVNLYSQKSVLVAVKKQLKEDIFESTRQPPTADSLQDPPESKNGTASTTTGSSDREHTAHTTNAPSASDVNEANGNRTGGEHNYTAETPWARMSASEKRTLQESTPKESTVQEGIVQDRINNMCGLYSLNPFCIERKYFQPETNRS